MKRRSWFGPARSERGARRSAAVAACEALEGRRLLSVSASVSGPAVAPEGPYVLNLFVSGLEPGSSLVEWTIDWGDAVVTTVPGAAPSATHSYDGFPGAEYAISATVSYLDASSVPHTQAATGTMVGFAGDALDGTFGSGGIAVTVTPDESAVNDMAVDALGRVVTVGSVGGQWEIRRYDPSGAPDTTFGEADPVTSLRTGRRVIDVAPLDATDQADAVALDGGKLVVAGHALLEGQRKAVVITLADDGTVDWQRSTAMKNAGGATADISTVSVAVQKDHRVVVGAAGNVLGLSDFALARYNADGSLDDGTPIDDTPGDAFGGDGFVATDFGGGQEFLNHVALRTDAAGNATGIVAVGTRNGTKTVVAGYSIDGDSVQVFDEADVNPAGPTSTGAEKASRALPLSDGRLVVIAEDHSGAHRVAVLRYNADGTIDAGFGDGGYARAGFGPFAVTVANAFVQGDGKVVVGTTLQNPSLSNPHAGDGGFGLFRFTLAGFPDPGFGGASDAELPGLDTSGRIFTKLREVGTSGLSGGGVARLADGRIVQAGTRPDPGFSNSGSDAVIVRYGVPAAIVSVLNVLPTAATVASGPVVPGHPAEFTFHTNDPNANEFTLYTIDWGDGSEPVQVGSAGPLVLEHAYTSSRTITVVAEEFDGGPATPPATFVVDVASRGAVLPDPARGGTMLVVGASDGAAVIHNKVQVQAITGGVEVKLDAVRIVGAGVGRVVVYGNAGDDSIQSGGVSIPVELYGGAGNDKLKGGAADDVLVGGDGDDAVLGCDGRDLLVGGLGADRVIGDSEDDILIGGVYADAGNRLVIAAVAAEWSRTDAGYPTRVGHLRDGTGAAADRLNVFSFLTPEPIEVSEDFDSSGTVDEWEVLAFGPTVFDDGVEDRLTGDAGLDWFFVNTDVPGRDRITDLTAGELATELELLFGPPVV